MLYTLYLSYHSNTEAVVFAVSLRKTLNAIFHLGAKQIPIVVAQPDKRTIIMTVFYRKVFMSHKLEKSTTKCIHK